MVLLGRTQHSTWTIRMVRIVSSVHSQPIVGRTVQMFYDGTTHCGFDLFKNIDFWNSRFRGFWKKRGQWHHLRTQRRNQKQPLSPRIIYIVLEFTRQPADSADNRTTTDPRSSCPTSNVTQNCPINNPDWIFKPDYDYSQSVFNLKTIEPHAVFLRVQLYYDDARSSCPISHEPQLPLN